MVLTLSLFDAGTLISLCLIVVFRIVIMLSLPLFFIGSLYSCMWLMQIYRSGRRARTSGLSVEYLVGTTLGRLFFICCMSSHHADAHESYLHLLTSKQTSWVARRTSST